MQAQEVMQRSVMTATPEISLALAWRLMHDHRIRHLPVVSGKDLVGMVTDRDLRHASPSLLTTLTPAEITYHMGTTAIATCMTRDVVTIRPEEDMGEGARRLLAGQFDCLPVVAQGQLVGLITVTDLLQGFLIAIAPMHEYMQVQNYMQRAVHTARPDERVSVVYQRMRHRRIRHLPIVREEVQLVGLVTDRDIRQVRPSTAPHMAEYELACVLDQMIVQKIMTTEMYTVRETTAIVDAGQLLLEHKVGCLPVVCDDNTLVGLMTSMDLLRAYVTAPTMS